MKEISLEDIKQKVHPYAIKAIIRMTTGKYKGIKFFFSDINSFASNLPEVGTTIAAHISEDTAYKIDNHYAGLLYDVASENSVDLYQEERLYDGMTIVSYDMFDKAYLEEGIFGFYAIDGKFYEKE